MAGILRGMKGRFILSINDHPEVRAIFDGFAMETADVRYTISGNDNAKAFGELIITN